MRVSGRETARSKERWSPMTVAEENVMKGILQYGMVLALVAGLAACSQGKADPGGASADAYAPAFAKSVVKKVTIPKGTKLRIALIDGVSTTKSSAGDPFMASLVEPIVIRGKTILDQGTKVHGRVTDVTEPGRVKGLASIRLVLTDVERNGKKVPISTKPFVATAQNTKKRDAKVIGGGAGVGALIGAIAGGAKGAAIGATVGGGAGAGTVLATKGKDIHYAPETRLSFSLANPLEI